MLAKAGADLYTRLHGRKLSAKMHIVLHDHKIIKSRQMVTPSLATGAFHPGCHLSLRAITNIYCTMLACTDERNTPFTLLAPSRVVKQPQRVRLLLWSCKRNGKTCIAA
jgi:hypothetical protein